MNALDPAQYRLRALRLDDLPAVAAIGNRIHPVHRTTEEVAEWRTAFDSPTHFRQELVAVHVPTDAVVAFASIEHHPHMQHPQKFWVGVEVDPDHRGHGVGSALYEELDRTARSLHAVRLWCSTQEADRGAVAFGDRRGFRTVRRVWTSRLDVASAHLERFPDRTASLERDGVRFTTLEAEGFDRPEVRREMYELYRATHRDIPSIGTRSDVTYEEFERSEVDRPGVRAGTVLLAARGDRYVGVSSIEPLAADASTLVVGFTGTLKELRGRGVATELKRRAVEFARARGFRSILTNNDSLNAPIWSINERLGFRPEATYLQRERRLDAETTA